MSNTIRAILIIVIASISCFAAVAYAANKEPQWGEVDKKPQEGEIDIEQLFRKVYKEKQWACYDFREYKWWDSGLSKRPKPPVIVMLKSFIISGRLQNTGSVEVKGGTDKFAAFRFDGIDREWSFGNHIEYKIILRPNRQAAYYDFRGLKDGEKTKPKQFFYCEQR